MWSPNGLPYPESNNLGNKKCIECYLQMTDIHFGVPPAPKKKSDHMIPGAIEPALGLHNVITLYLLLCPGIGNTWTSSDPALLILRLHQRTGDRQQTTVRIPIPLLSHILKESVILIQDSGEWGAVLLSDILAHGVQNVE
ncbi:hypothetical protein AVEN_258195-1 [Araneus ventricosus]|uniref:Uncharacterized protein n=1 Tax=Araneus ventricosus TaxID=182803 RepID=A0A4Y2TNR3_ARAVE|nr:hypothetical protein AVEN_258195-1 [Araneus ventricosus]